VVIIEQRLIMRLKQKNRPKIREMILPVQWEEWEEIGIEFGNYRLENVDFIDDFGPIRKGSHYKYVEVDITKGIIVVYNNSKNKINIEVKLVPLEEYNL
jgi:hypothetical protein